MHCYFIDKSGEMIFEVNGFQNVRSFSEGLAVIRKANSFCGFIDKSGSVVIEMKFFEATPFSEGLAVVKTQEKGFLSQPETMWGFINRTGRIIFEANFDRLYAFSEGVAIAVRGRKFFLIDKTGHEIISFSKDEIQLEFVGNQKFSEGLIVAYDTKTSKCGFIDKTGEFVIEPQFENAANFSEGLARVSIKENYREYLGFINPTGEFVISPQFDIDSDFPRGTTDFSEGLASLIEAPLSMEKEQNFNYIDKTGEIVLRTDYFRAEPFHDGLAVVWDVESQKCGYIDKSGKLIIPLKYDIANDFSEGLAMVAEY